MNSLIASGINEGFNNQQVANGSRASILLSSVEFTVTGHMRNTTPSQQDKAMIKLTGKEELLYNGQAKMKSCDQNKNPSENYMTLNGSKEKSAEDTIPTPKIQLYTGKIHVEWNQVHKIGAGLHNLGNTCFMNTVVQCLTYLPPLANYLLHDNDHSAKCHITGFCMMCLLQKHMKRTIGKTGEVIKPLDIYQRLKLIAKHFQFGRQEDAHEFLRYVIDHLWKSCLPQTNGVTKLDSASKETTVINKIFGGYHRSQVICLRCKKESNTFDHFMDFILDIKQNVMSLEKALEKFTQPELLQQENCYKCPKCKMKVEAQKRFSVYRAPTVATFQLKRFDYNRSFGGKITKQISYPEKLNLRPYMSDTQGDPVLYRLNAVLVHSGPTCNSGHYYCFVKNSNGYWYIMDDQSVHQVGVHQVLNQGAYVLFYIKTESTERAPLKKCLDNKNSFMKGTISNSHFSKVSEMNNLKSISPSENISPFSNNSKTHNTPSSGKKFPFSSPNREKISFGFRTNLSSSPVLSPNKNRTVASPEPASTVHHGGLVPYVEDSSESSDASVTSPPPQNMQNNDAKPLLKYGSLESYKSAPRLEIKAKLSKSVFGTVSRSVRNGSPKVGSWVITDAPQSPTSFSSTPTGVHSTTDWHVMEAPDVTVNGGKDYIANNSAVSSTEPPHQKDYDVNKGYASSAVPNTETPHQSGYDINKSYPISSVGVQHQKDFVVNESSNLHEMPSSRHSANCNETLTSDPSSCTRKSNGLDDSPSSAQKSNFRKQIHKSKHEETNGSFKRKFSDSCTKISKDSPLAEHGESEYSPVPKKVKHIEDIPLVNLEWDVTNTESNARMNSVNDNATSQTQCSASLNCDSSDSRTCLLVNGISRSEDSDKVISSRNSNGFNGAAEMEKNLKGKQDNSHLESSKFMQHDKEKLPMGNHGKNSSLYGTEVPTWREENHCRPSAVTGYEVRRTFDEYDTEFDRGKVRKSKSKDRYHQFNGRNPFQKYPDRFHNRYNGKFYNHHNHRKYDSHHNKWKQNSHSRDGGYQRYRNNNNHHRRY